MKKTFTYTDDKSSKFWSIEVSSNSFTVNYGKTGTTGQTQTKTFDTEAQCQKEAEKLIAEKTKKGYVEEGAATTERASLATGTLGEQIAALKKHFEPWTPTPACKEILQDLLARLVACRDNAGWLELDLKATDGTVYSAQFGAPNAARAPKDMPASHRKAAALHGSVTFDNGDVGGFYWDASGDSGSFEGYDDYDFEEDEDGKFSSNEERYKDFAQAAQNWFLLDKGRKNKLGEPLIITFDHGGDFSDARIFGGDTQLNTAFGIPGFILRVISYYILENDPRLEDCDMG